MSVLRIDPIESAELIVRRLLAVRPGEQVAIVCDPKSEMQMAHLLAEVVERQGAEYTILIMPERGTQQANQLTRVIAKGLEAADCLIGMTRASGAPTYSAVVKSLYNARKLRTISMVFRNMSHFTSGGALADYDALYADGQQLAALWKAARVMHIATPQGTNIRAPIASDHVIVECGFATEPGLEAAFSDGEVSSRPLEGTAEGTIVVDGPICYLGVPDRPITLRVRQGKVVAVEGDSPQAEELRRIIQTIENADNIAEFGIGLNPCSLRNGDFEEEKKARGLVHIAIGDNVFYGGQVRCQVHMDMVIYAPTVRLDDRVVVEAGNISV